MRMFLFAKRNIKEILRDPINLFFSLGFPLILLVLLSIQFCYSARSEKHDVSNKKSRAGLGNVRQRIYGIICRYVVIKRPYIFFLNAFVYISYDCDGFYFRLYFTYDSYDSRTSCNNLMGGGSFWT